MTMVVGPNGTRPTGMVHRDYSLQIDRPFVENLEESYVPIDIMVFHKVDNLHKIHKPQKYIMMAEGYVNQLLVDRKVHWKN